ncbi:MAG: hypothetical protein HY271_07390 [Deltaproteobacteria bacterium]|nr:hypothetical protein [Deltaproteobacteria bacterium]
MLRRCRGWRHITPALACTIVLTIPPVALADTLRSRGEVAVADAAAGSQMRYYVDPQTGAILPGPPAGAPEEPSPRAVTAPAPEPVLVPAPGGGMMIVVPEDRAQSFRGTLDADGHARGECVPSTGGRP